MSIYVKSSSYFNIITFQVLFQLPYCPNIQHDKH